MIDWEAMLGRSLIDRNDAESHVERDPYTFHPSYLSRCKRTAVKNKFGLEDHGMNTLWNFKLGTLIHSYLEGVDAPAGLRREIPCDYTDPAGFTLRGTADVYDAVDGIVYDFKTRKSWNYFDPPDDAHMDQITCYMQMLDAVGGQVVYVLKSAPWDEDEPIVRTHPDGESFPFDPDRWERLRDKAVEIMTWVEDEGAPSSVDDIPFEPCGCFICRGES